MDQTPSSAARRNEDIALDLLKFIAGHANLAKPTGTTTPGFGAASSAKPEDQVDHLLELYSRCRAAVDAPASTPAPAKK